MDARKALRLIRVYHDLSLAQIAGCVGLPEKHVLALETGKRKITLAVMERYATAFEIPISSLILLAEQTDGIFSMDTRDYVAKKVIAIIDWLTSVSAARWRDATVILQEDRIQSSAAIANPSPKAPGSMARPDLESITERGKDEAPHRTNRLEHKAGVFRAGARGRERRSRGGSLSIWDGL